MRGFIGRCVFIGLFCLGFQIEGAICADTLDPAYVLERAKEVNKFKDFIIDADMIQKGPNLPKRLYRVNMKAKAVGEETVFLIRFLKPLDIQGLGVLLRRKGPCSSEQLIYLPSVRRIISLSNDGDQPSLVQTDFEAEDLGNPHLFWTSSRFVRKDAIEGRSAYVYESFPDSPRCSRYQKVESWIDIERFLPLKLVKYGREGNPLKEFRFGRLYLLKKKWLATEMVVTDLDSKHSTTLRITGGRYGITIPDSEFSREALKSFRKDTEESPPMEGN